MSKGVSAALANRRLVGWHVVVLSVFVLDQITKAWAVHALQFRDAIAIFPGFNLSLAFNRGAAFSFLSEGSGWQRGFLIGFSLLMMGVLVAWLRSVLKRPDPSKRFITGLGLVFGGALGNLLDRLETGRVVDFIQWYYQTWAWPTFNIADAAICVGIVLLAYELATSKT